MPPQTPPAPNLGTPEVTSRPQARGGGEGTAQRGATTKVSAPRNPASNKKKKKRRQGALYGMERALDTVRADRPGWRGCKPSCAGRRGDERRREEG